jgi:hypothetical protein
MAAKKAIYNILDLKGNVITGLGAPSLDSDAATKASAQAQADAAGAAALDAAKLDATTKADTALASAKTYSDGLITNLINSAPETLDTLGEIAAALSSGETATSAIVTSLATKTTKFVGTATGTAGSVTADGHEYTITHSLGKADVIVQAFDGNDVVDVFIRKVNNNSLKVITGATLGATSLSIVVVG